MDDLLTSILDETISEVAPEIVTGIAKTIRKAQKQPLPYSYQSRLLKENELSEAVKNDTEHPEHEGACEQSPEGVEGDSDEGEYQPSLQAVPTEGKPVEGKSEKPSGKAKEEMPENLLKADAPPMQKREALRPRYQVTPQELRRSIIAAEILGKPLALRKKYR